MNRAQTYGPYGHDGEYVWVSTERLKEDRRSEPVAPSVFIKPNIAYQSPITGEAVTTWAKRRYDMESSRCVDYREGREMAQDARRNMAKECITTEDVAKAAAKLGHI